MLLSQEVFLVISGKKEGRYEENAMVLANGRWLLVVLHMFESECTQLFAMR
jgi:hypothetical protein